MKHVPENRRLIGTKWVFRIKNDGRHRSRLCATGYTQVAGVDFQENYAPVVNDVTFRIVMAMLLENEWEAEIVDVETASLYGDLEEEIYLKIPEGLAEHTGKEVTQDYCFILDKAMYGLVQAARQYYKKFFIIMIQDLGFKMCLADSCLL